MSYKVLAWRFRLLAGWLAVLVAACVSAGTPGGSPTANPSTTAIPKPAAGYRLYVEDRYGKNMRWRVSVVDSGSGQVEHQLPLGVADHDWSRLYAVEQDSGQPTLRVVDPASGNVPREIQLVRSYSSLLLFPSREPLSPNGRWLTLQAEDQG